LQHRTKREDDHVTQAPYPNDPRYSVSPAGPVPFAVPVGYAGAALFGPQRPAGVTVLAILGIIGGLILLLGGAVTLGGVILAPAANPLLREATFFYWSAIDGVLRLVAGAALLAASIGAFTLKPWARRWMIMGATLLTVLTVGDIVLMVGWILPMIENRPAVSYGGRGGAPDENAFMALNVFKWALAIGYATGVFVILNGRTAKAAFSTVASPLVPPALGAYPAPGVRPGYPPPPANPGAPGIGAGPPVR
jgi:hypothetical protein